MTLQDAEQLNDQTAYVFYFLPLGLRFWGIPQRIDAGEVIIIDTPEQIKERFTLSTIRLDGDGSPLPAADYYAYLREN